jgi:NAD(P)-dependent dehydrogenase (short-subunit alcohol dehydrogenase family)
MRIVVTGSSGGIGASLKDRLLAEGHEVWGLARRNQSAGHTATFHSSVCDVSSWSEVEAAAKQVQAAWGRADGLICCAGVQGAVGPALSLDPAKWSETVHANLDGTYFAIRAFGQLLEKTSAPRAKVLCFAGGGATGSRPNFSAYGCAKTAIVRLVEILQDELKGARFDLNAIAPGAIRTQLTEEVVALGPSVVGDGEYAQAKKVLETGGGSLDKVYELVDFLLSPRSDCIGGRLFAAQWDPWRSLPGREAEFAKSDTYLLRRVVPREWS